MTMMRIKMMRERPFRKTGTLVCRECGADRQVALYEGGRCRLCHDFHMEHAGMSSGPEYYSIPRPQLRETVSLKAKVEAVMHKRGLSQERMGKLLGLAPVSFKRWVRGRMSAKSQRKVNAAIARRLEVARG